MHSETVEIPTADSLADAYLTRPDDQPHPWVLYIMDAYGLRPTIDEMADRIAADGYVVLAPNVFYRAGRPPVVPLPDLSDPEQRAGFFQSIRPLIGQLTPERLAADGGAYLDYLTQVASPGGRRSSGSRRSRARPHPRSRGRARHIGRVRRLPVLVLRASGIRDPGPTGRFRRLALRVAAPAAQRRTHLRTDGRRSLRGRGRPREVLGDLRPPAGASGRIACQSLDQLRRGARARCRTLPAGVAQAQVRGTHRGRR